MKKARFTESQYWVKGKIEDYRLNRKIMAVVYFCGDKITSKLIDISLNLPHDSISSIVQLAKSSKN